MKNLSAVFLTVLLALLVALRVSGQVANQNPFTAAELKQLLAMGFELATPDDRAAAKAAGVKWREVETFEDAVSIASEFRAIVNAIESNVSSNGPGDVPSNLFYNSQASSVLTRKTSIVKYSTSHIEVGVRATRTTTYDPVSGKVKYTWSDATEHWIGWYGLTLGWLENDDTSVSYPSGRLKVVYSADIVVPVGPFTLRERKSGWRSWKS